jgi:dipeptidase E
MAERHIVAIGGWPHDDDAAARALEDFALLHARGRRICFVPTATAESADSIVGFYTSWRGQGELSHLEFFPWPPEGLRELMLQQDVLVVGGGNTANMLAIWRVHGFDRILREAWAGGVVLSGWSAGMICWFEAGLTDSFGPQLDGMRDGLGFLSGSACPHYDGEELRAPVYRRLVTDGFPAGIAADDGVAVHYVGTEVAEVVTARDGATAYRVEAEAEMPLEARRLA